ncbi:hypothetical protein KP509_21G087400 [Ceratopteris richardii]|nr:hypothetical protein KP509_21G087400 [Ceratopteris richardii]
MASLLGNISKRIEIATKPPTKIIDRTLPRKQITLENLEDYIKEAKEFYGMGKPGDMNIAVVGAKGVGKSSLINGLIGAHDDDKEAATVGKSNENPVRYRNRLMEAMVLWEMPAGGERGHPSLTFFHDHKLYAFDWILIVSDRFHRLDFEVARSASRLNRRCTFVRTKCDLAVQTIIQRSGIAEINAKQVLRKEVEGSFQEGLRLIGLEDRSTSFNLFLVSATAYSESHEREDDASDSHTHKFDEDRLLNYLSGLVRRGVIRRTRTMR